MIRPLAMMDVLTAEPFRPFRVHLASGRTFEVRHPEMMRIGRSSVTVFMDEDAETGQSNKWQEVSLMLMESVEPLENQVAR